MSISFFPSRERMYKEIEQWIVLGKLDTLLSLCNCCVFKLHQESLALECRACLVRKGIARIARENHREYYCIEGEELLGVC
jgi:hypothetical protein